MTDDKLKQFKEVEHLVSELQSSKDAAYAERDKLVALLASLFPSWIARHPDNEAWEDDWRWIVFVELPAWGQLSWHIHDSELEMFKKVLLQTKDDPSRPWDGHTTEEKYQRVLGFAEAAAKAVDCPVCGG